MVPSLPKALAGSAPALAIDPGSEFGVEADSAMASSFEAEYAAAADQLLGRSGREAFEASRVLKQLDSQRYRPSNGAQYPRSPFGSAAGSFFS